MVSSKTKNNKTESTNDKEIKQALIDILNSAESEGCDGCVTVGLQEINDARVLLGWDILADITDF